MLSNFSQKKTFLFVFLSQKNSTLWVDWSTLERELLSPVTHRRASNILIVDDLLCEVVSGDWRP